MASELILAIAAFATATISGVIGFGGGMLLIAVMPLFLPPLAIVPIHGVVQLASNASRMTFSWRDVHWRLALPFIAGSILGVALFALVLFNISTDHIPIAISIYILLNLWSEPFARALRRYESLYTVGFMQSGLGIVVGTPGPLALTLLAKRLEDPNHVIATTALFVTISHLVKLLIFGLMGFSFLEYWPVMVLMLTGSVLGSWAGTRIRTSLDHEKLALAVKVLLTGLCLKMMLDAV